MSWKNNREYLICDDCGVVCTRAGWFEKIKSLLFSGKFKCCLCADAEHHCPNCLRMLKKH